jgi:RNA polymerase sigma-70 factor (ECF subfamily)
MATSIAPPRRRAGATRSDDALLAALGAQFRHFPTLAAETVDVRAPSEACVGREPAAAGSVGRAMFELFATLSVARHEPSAADAESRAWVQELKSSGEQREQAIARLRALLLRAARYEVNRRRATLGHLGASECDDLAEQSASDALMAVLNKLENYRGDSRFSTWAYKFALLEAGVKLRRRAWHGREMPLEDAAWKALTTMHAQPERDAETGELIAAIKVAIEEDLTARQREVLVALALNGVPIDVLAERLGSTRGALYKTLHDARRKLRARPVADGHRIALPSGGAP